MLTNASGLGQVVLRLLGLCCLLDSLQLWTEQSSRELIAEYFPWFLSTYEGYAHPVQRVDTVRYFALQHFGGIYLDLDNVNIPLLPLLL